VRAERSRHVRGLLPSCLRVCLLVSKLQWQAHNFLCVRACVEHSAFGIDGWLAGWLAAWPDGLVLKLYRLFPDLFWTSIVSWRALRLGIRQRAEVSYLHRRSIPSRAPTSPTDQHVASGNERAAGHLRRRRILQQNRRIANDSQHCGLRYSAHAQCSQSPASIRAVVSEALTAGTVVCNHTEWMPARGVTPTDRRTASARARRKKKDKKKIICMQAVIAPPNGPVVPSYTHLHTCGPNNH
jgi:hypothetical protein